MVTLKDINTGENGEKPYKSQIVQSITRAANILKLMSRGSSYSISNICKEVELSKGTVHRLLKTLEASGFVVQDPATEHYRFGQFIVSLASNFMISHQNLISSCIDEMEYLRNISVETVCLSIAIGTRRFTLEELPSHQNIKFTVGKGFAVPLYLGSGGKILLAEMTEIERNKIIKGINSSSNEIKLPVSKEALKAEIANIQTQGYAISYGEVIDEAAAISFPIKGYMCPACISVVCPAYRFSGIMKVQHQIKESVDRISSILEKTEAR